MPPILSAYAIHYLERLVPSTPAHPRVRRSILACGAPTTPITVRIATFNASLFRDTAGGLIADLSTPRNLQFNASLFRDTAGGLIADLSTPRNPQGKVVAEIIQRSRPDILLINEFDYDSLAAAVRLFQEHYLVSGNRSERLEQYLRLGTDPIPLSFPGTRQYRRAIWHGPRQRRHDWRPG
jgi:hypothetical protein